MPRVIGFCVKCGLAVDQEAQERYVAFFSECPDCRVPLLLSEVGRVPLRAILEAVLEPAIYGRGNPADLVRGMFATATDQERGRVLDLAVEHGLVVLEGGKWRITKPGMTILKELRWHEAQSKDDSPARTWAKWDIPDDTPAERPRTIPA